MNDPFEKIRQEIIRHEDNQQFTELGYVPLFAASPTAKIVVIGQAPGIKAQTNAKPWSDASGDKLIRWLGVSEEDFRDPSKIAHMPMDFYYPGKARTGDLPPRKDFARLWHPRILAHLPNVKLTLLIGRYSQEYYLGNKQVTLTETIRNYANYLPKYLPLVHPSPLNFRWHRQNQWFEGEVIPELQRRVRSILYS